ncbi:hypothetical protein HDU83_002589 [Entophlyctis luteolus]|nr:hypothetical protein HDU83_002589 [Entophlyctis luteolus]
MAGASGAAPQQNDTSNARKPKIPIMVPAVVLMVAILASTAIPLGYIAFKSSADITSDLTLQLIETTANLVASDIQTELGKAATMQLYTPMFGVTTTPCASSSPNSRCFAKAFASVSGGANLYLQPLNTTTGLGEADPFILIPGVPPLPSDYYFYTLKAKSFYDVNFLTTPTGYSFLLEYREIYTPHPSNPLSQRSSILNFDCLGPFHDLFVSLLPSPGSNIVFIDDGGLLVVTTMNGTARNATTRYDTYKNNPYPAIRAVGGFLAARYGVSATGAFQTGTNFTFDFVDIGGTSYFVATQQVAMAGTDQSFMLILFAPRSDFYAKSDNATKTGLIQALVIAACGILLTAAIAYFGTLPLKRLASSMEKLAKFDFSDLEAGHLESNSLLSELNRVESTFFVMVKVRHFNYGFLRTKDNIHQQFAIAIKKNKELTSMRVSANSQAQASMVNDGAKKM